MVAIFKPALENASRYHTDTMKELYVLYKKTGSRISKKGNRKKIIIDIIVVVFWSFNCFMFLFVFQVDVIGSHHQLQFQCLE